MRQRLCKGFSLSSRFLRKSLKCDSSMRRLSLAFQVHMRLQSYDAGWGFWGQDASVMCEGQVESGLRTSSSGPDPKGQTRGIFFNCSLCGRGALGRLALGQALCLERRGLQPLQGTQLLCTRTSCTSAVYYDVYFPLCRDSKTCQARKAPLPLPIGARKRT